MALRIEDYALIGNTLSAALVGRDGSIDWLCMPRFDSGACFAALLGEPDNGRWLIAPDGEITSTRRSYRGDTLIVETEFHTASGVAAVIDFMPFVEHGDLVDVVRIVEGRRGTVPMKMELTLTAPRDGTIEAIRYVVGDMVEEGAELLHFAEQA